MYGKHEIPHSFLSLMWRTKAAWKKLRAGELDHRTLEGLQASYSPEQASSTRALSSIRNGLERQLPTYFFVTWTDHLHLTDAQSPHL